MGAKGEILLSASAEPRIGKRLMSSIFKAKEPVNWLFDFLNHVLDHVRVCLGNNWAISMSIQVGSSKS